MKKIPWKRLKTTLGQPPIESLVPGRDPIELVSYYAEFSNYYPTCELQTKAWLVQNVKEDWVQLDAGANVGYHSILMGSLAPFGEVHSFEPTDTHEMLMQNLKNAKLSNVTAVRKGLGATSEVKIEKIYKIWGQAPEILQMEFISIDDYVEEIGFSRVDFIKIDVDGFDYEVLVGAKNTIEKFRPHVLIEINHALATRNYTGWDVFDFMIKCKYSHALVLDKDNYIFSSNWELGDPWPSEITMSFDRSEPLMANLNNIELAPLMSSSISSVGDLKNGAMLTSDGIVEIESAPWNYAYVVDISTLMRPNQAVRIQVDVLTGSLGVFISDEESTLQLHKEIIVTNGYNQSVVFFELSQKAAKIVFRTVSHEKLSFRIEALEVGPYTTTQPGRSGGSLQEHLGPQLGVELAEKLFREVVAVSAEELGSYLSFKNSLAKCGGISDKSNHLMERDDAQYLQWIWREFNPERHFEFGTWEGFGSALCLKSSKAHVWTLNLDEGLSGSAGQAYTESREPALRKSFLGPRAGASDSLSFIGWMYKALELQDRVTQLYGNSTTFDFSALDGIHFDSIFIDGGHDLETVSADQISALKLVSPGGLIVWHDFTMDLAIFKGNSSCRGVVEAVAMNLDMLKKSLDLFWLKDSMLLIGRVK